jgi:hypothetical protein
MKPSRSTVARTCSEPGVIVNLLLVSRLCLAASWAGSDAETTTASGGRDQECESADPRDTAGRRLLLDPGLTSGFEERLFVDHKKDVRSVTLSSTKVRKVWPG